MIPKIIIATYQALHHYPDYSRMDLKQVQHSSSRELNNILTISLLCGTFPHKMEMVNNSCPEEQEII